MRLTRLRISLFSQLARTSALHGATVFVALAAAIALTACTSAAGAGPGTAPRTSLTQTVSAPTALAPTTWILAQMSIAGAAQPLVAGRVLTLQFHPQEGKVSGYSGCNDYFGDYTLAGESLSLNQLGQTLMACVEVCPTISAGSCRLSDAPVMEEESAYMNALMRVTRLHLADNTLTLSSSDGAVKLTYHPA
ncbi:MAG TPA: META domain-containing protein [Ktedonobacterales bacterium]|nr:META domain-containing protein [Ktedonobacterales bacterium]